MFSTKSSTSAALFYKTTHIRFVLSLSITDGYIRANCFSAYFVSNVVENF